MLSRCSFYQSFPDHLFMLYLLYRGPPALPLVTDVMCYNIMILYVMCRHMVSLAIISCFIAPKCIACLDTSKWAFFMAVTVIC